MSFRLFVYYCAVIGAWAALAGWYLGRQTHDLGELGGQAVKGFWLGLAVSLALGLLDALWNFSARRLTQVVPRVLLAGVVGGSAGLLGATLGQGFYSRFQAPRYLVIGWAFTGLLVGMSLGAFDLLAALFRTEGLRGARRKARNGALGGLCGGWLGGTLYLAVDGAMHRVFEPKESLLRSPSAVGFLVLGACVGLLIGLAQVLLKEAWLKVESGWRPGRAVILGRPEITVGRNEACDVGLFGDPNVERLHARIRRRGDDYLLEGAGSAAPMYVNDQPVTDQVALRSGDAIRIGRNVLRFYERRKRPAEIVG